MAIDKNNDNGISTGKLLRNRPFILYCILTGLLTISLFFVDIPFLDHFTDHTYLNDIRINWAKWMSNYFYFIIITVVLNSLSQLMIKKGMNNVGTIEISFKSFLKSIDLILFNPFKVDL